MAIDLEARRKYQREYAAKKRHDPESRAKVQEYQRERLRKLREGDPSVRKKNAEYVRMKRATDEVYLERAKFYSRRYNDEVTAQFKEACINMYSNGDACCAWCPQSDIDVLCLDHINNDGKQWRATGVRSGKHLYKWLIDNDYPEGLQVLCANCNMKKEILRARAAKEARRLTQRTWPTVRTQYPRDGQLV